jgi:CubicO group peptidase (beta-lactamase class C family)
LQSVRYIKQTLLIFAFTITALSKVVSQNITPEINKLILTQFKEKASPGGVFLVTKKGKPIYHYSFGKANLELNVNLSNEHVFQLGSITKQFTAIAILMLEEQGKLSTTDSISKYITDYPNGNKITIHHLLTHTSGIKDYTELDVLADIVHKEMTPKALVELSKNEAVDFAPGEKFKYNNSGYILLGYIIELVSGETYKAFIEKHIFQKLGMTHSLFGSDRQIILNRAYGYQKKETAYVNKKNIHLSLAYSAGALLSNTEDMLKWQNALTKNLLISEERKKKAFSKNKLNNGEEFTYGYGWHIKTINEISIYEHGGSIFGFKSMGVYIPSEDIYVLSLTNCDCNSPTQLTRDIAKLVLDNIGKK